jgi:hypothetical protein
MAKTPIIALLTDFGTTDHYVGTMKGVLLSRNPQARIVDVSHGVLPQQIQQAGFLLWTAYRYFPKRTIFVCVVDPGVGSAREILVVKTAEYTFIAPENGLLDLVLSELKVVQSFHINQRNEKLFEKNISQTFHARDIFAPVAAALSRGTSAAKLGKKFTLPKQTPRLVEGAGSVVKPVVLHVDRFGNCVTNIAASAGGEKPRLSIGVTGRGIVSTWVTHYGAAPERTPFLVAGSSRLVEICVKNDSAARLLSIDVGSSLKTYWH